MGQYVSCLYTSGNAYDSVRSELMLVIITAVSLVQLVVAARSKASVCGRPLAEIAGSNPAEGVECFSPVSVVCCQVEVYWTD